MDRVMFNDTEDESNYTIRKDGMGVQCADRDPEPVPDARYQLVVYWRRWWTPIQRVEVMDKSYTWMKATQAARDIINAKDCAKVYVVVKMRRYTNPGAVKQSVVEILRGSNA